MQLRKYWKKLKARAQNRALAKLIIAEERERQALPGQSVAAALGECDSYNTPLPERYAKR